MINWILFLFHIRTKFKFAVNERSTAYTFRILISSIGKISHRITLCAQHWKFNIRKSFYNFFVCRFQLCIRYFELTRCRWGGSPERETISCKILNWNFCSNKQRGTGALSLRNDNRVRCRVSVRLDIILIECFYWIKRDIRRNYDFESVIWRFQTSIISIITIEPHHGNFHMMNHESWQSLAIGQWIVAIAWRFISCEVLDTRWTTNMVSCFDRRYEMNEIKSCRVSLNYSGQCTQLRSAFVIFFFSNSRNHFGCTGRAHYSLIDRLIVANERASHSICSVIGPTKVICK